jgi:outer membrane lipoprotein SlyB
MKPNRVRASTPIVLLASALALGACAGPAYEPYDSSGRAEYYAPRVQYGTVDRIEVLRDGAPPVPVGALLGGIAGGVIGHQIGGGTGNTVATIAGAVGGALVGNEVQRRNQVQGDRYRVTVRTDSGALASFEQRQSMALRIGDRVRIENDRVYLL